MRCSVLIALLLFLPSAGCAGYFRDRLKDASEMFELGMGISVGVEANVRATKLIQVGFGSYCGDWMGLKEGRLALWQEQRAEMGLLPLYYHEVFRTSDTLIDIQHPLFGEGGYDVYLNDIHLITDRGFFEIGLTVNLMVVGVDVAVEGAEIADFLTGWFGWDLLADDCYSRSLEALVHQAQSASPYRRAAAVRALHRRTGLRFGYVISTVGDEHTDGQIEAWQSWNQWLKTGLGEGVSRAEDASFSRTGTGANPP